MRFICFSTDCSTQLSVLVLERMCRYPQPLHDAAQRESPACQAAMFPMVRQLISIAFDAERCGPIL
jgi:hypothetical protein